MLTCTLKLPYGRTVHLWVLGSDYSLIDLKPPQRVGVTRDSPVSLSTAMFLFFSAYHFINLSLA